MVDIFFNWLAALLEVCCNASATIPLLISLGLVAGRRGHAQLCLEGNKIFSSLALGMAFCGIFYFPYTYWCQFLAFNSQAGNIWSPFFQLPGLPWSLSLLAQIIGTFLFWQGQRQLCSVRMTGPKYSFEVVKKPVIFFLLAAGCFFATFFLINWPFAGIPQGLTMDRAVFAVMRNAVRHYFLAFSPAGALGLVYMFISGFANGTKGLASRWLAFWACVGLIPQVAQDWAILLGLGLRGNAAVYFPSGLGWHFAEICLITIAIFLWFWQALVKKPLPVLAFSALALFLLHLSLPYCRKASQVLFEPVISQKTDADFDMRPITILIKDRNLCIITG